MKNVFKMINPAYWIIKNPYLFLKIDNPSFNLQNELINSFMKKNNNLKYSLLVDLIRKISYSTLLYKLETELNNGNIYYDTDKDFYNPYHTLQVPVTFGNGVCVGGMGSGKSASIRAFYDYQEKKDKLIAYIKSNKYYNNSAQLILEHIYE